VNLFLNFVHTARHILEMKKDLKIEKNKVDWFIANPAAYWISGMEPKQIQGSV